MELGLYLHLPYCPSRCPYCDFWALPYQPGPARRLLAALPRHLELLAPRAGGRRLATVYVGGGTPSMWPVRDLAGLLEELDRVLGLAPGAEVTLEANPGTLSRAKLRALRAAGFNRLSLGAQSFSARSLARLGRRHGPEQTRRAVALARAAGFHNLNLDLIYGLPGQSPEQAAADVAAALALEPEHISLYELTLNPYTPWGRRYRKGQAPLPGEEAVLAMERRARSLLGRAGFERYEVSNFSRPGRACRHNQATWRGADYLALGPGAHGHLAGRRWANHQDPGRYLEDLARGREPLAFCERLSPRDRARELVMLGLRTSRGMDMEQVGRLLGQDPRRLWARALERIQQEGWACLQESRLVPTSRGLDMADSAASLFF